MMNTRNTLCLCCILSLLWCTSCAPPTCYSRVLELSREITTILDKLHTTVRTKACAVLLPTVFLDPHNSCIRTKLRDLLYVVENLPVELCRERPRVRLLRRRTHTLLNIISRACHRDLVFFTDDCEALETGNPSPRYTEDRLQRLVEDD
uniref:cytokine like 1 precursor n=1 Tax=Danio rerio TaxID=7955 RepID=UPI001599AEE5|nr:cytokine-like protein [Danio rerio]